MASGDSGLLCAGARRTRARRQAQATAAPAGAALAADKQGGNAGHESLGEGVKVNEMKMRGRGPFL